jgi:uncharacterized membrane protein YtjA (UPF0391 family)
MLLSINTPSEQGKMRYWTVTLVLLAITAAILPLARVAHTIIGDAQIIFALALLALLARLIRDAWGPDAPLAAEPPGPAPGDVPTPE